MTVTIDDLNRALVELHNYERPSVIMVSLQFAASHHAILATDVWRARGANWRRLKREYRKAYEADLRRRRSKQN